MQNFFVLAIAVFIFCSCNNPTQEASHNDSLKIRMLDVGQGLSVLLEHDGKYALYDTGPDSAGIANILKTNHATNLEWITISHFHRDHAGGFLEFAKKNSGIDFRELYLGGDTLSSFVKDSVLLLAHERGNEPKYVSRGDVIKLGDCSFSVLWPSSEAVGENAASIVLSLKVSEESLLLVGDLEAEQEEQLLQMSGGIRGSVLQIGHHGSKTSSSLKFLEAVAPKYALISVGKKNSYGHPAAETLSKLNFVTGDSARILRTDRDGTICLEWEFNVGVWPCE